VRGLENSSAMLKPSANVICLLLMYFYNAL